MLAVLLAFFFLIAIGLLWRTREHLTPQGNIQAPGGAVLSNGRRRYSPEQEEQIWSMIPESSRIFMLSLNRKPGWSEARVRTEAISRAAWMIAIFYKDVYEPAKSAITPTDVDNFVNKRALMDSPEYGKMLRAYFIDGMPPQSASAPPPVSTPDPVSTQAPAPSPAENSPAPASTSSPTTSTPAPANQTIDVVSPSTITINVRAAA